MNRVSLRNEGKIHLGLIYANDPTFKTARLQLTGGLRFAVCSNVGLAKPRISCVTLLRLPTWWLAILC